MAKQEKITIDNTEYPLADLSDEAKQQLANLKATDAEIENLNSRLAIAQTARNAYAQALASALPQVAAN